MQTFFSGILLLALGLSACRQNEAPDLGGYNQGKVDSAQGDALADIRKGDIHLIAYGTPDFFMMDKIDSLAKQYGFYYKNEGCVIDVTSDAYSKIYNKVMVDFLEKRNGKNWMKRFDRDADAIEKSVYHYN